MPPAATPAKALINGTGSVDEEGKVALCRVEVGSVRTWGVVFIVSVFWLEEWEKQEIVNFHLKNPLEGYRRLTFMLLDADIVAVSPSSVWRGRGKQDCWALKSAS